VNQEELLKGVLEWKLPLARYNTSMRLALLTDDS